MARPGKSVGDMGQRQIVRGDQPEGAAIDESLDDGGGADLPVVRVGAAQQFIQQEQNRAGTAGERDNFAQTGDLGIEAGTAVLQRILHANRDAQAQRRNLEARGAHRSAGPRQHGVDPDGAQQGAFAGHVGAADDPEPGFAAQAARRCGWNALRSSADAPGLRLRTSRLGCRPSPEKHRRDARSYSLPASRALRILQQCRSIRGCGGLRRGAIARSPWPLARSTAAQRRWAGRPCFLSSRDVRPAGPRWAIL